MMLRADMTAITGPFGTAPPLMATTGAIVPSIPIIAATLIGSSGAINTNGATRRGDSIIITGVTIAASILVSTTAAYALSKKRFKLKKTLFAINTVALMFVPIAVTLILMALSAVILAKLGMFK